MLTRFLWMCSGADTDILEKCPRSEQIKHAGIGGTILFTALMAMFAAAYAIFTVFDNIWISLAFGTIWGLLIFNLDRFIVSSMRKQNDRMKELGKAVPRLVLALIIAVVIAKPLELKIFEKEIDQVLVEQKNAMLLENNGQVAALFQQENDALDSEINRLDAEVISERKRVETLYETYISEAEGRDGTMLLGKGPVYKEKREKHDEAKNRLNALEEENREKKAALLADKELLQTQEKQRLAQTEPIIEGFDGLMARIDALGTLPFLPSFFIFLLFLAIETAPIFAKVMSERGEYDLRFNDRLQKMSVWADQRINERQRLLDADHEINERVYASLANEDEIYLDKKQKARTVFHLRSEAFLKEQEQVLKTR